jgi:hypothetical protein
MSNWIKGAIKHPGALHEDLGVPQGQPIPAGKLATAAEQGGKVGQRARLAETLKGFHRASGGRVMKGGAPRMKNVDNSGLKKEPC